MNSAESPHLVFNELVAQRLAMLVGVPIPAGGLVIGPAGLGFVSLQLGAPGITIPDLGGEVRAVAHRYPTEVARLLVFDAWIGNQDRAQNIKAAAWISDLDFFAAFDHSHALLGAAGEPNASLALLNSSVSCVSHHPMKPWAQAPELTAALKRLRDIPESFLLEACSVPPMVGVPPTLQHALSSALLRRRGRLTIEMLQDAGR